MLLSRSSVTSSVCYDLDLKCPMKTIVRRWRTLRRGGPSERKFSHWGDALAKDSGILTAFPLVFTSWPAHTLAMLYGAAAGPKPWGGVAAG